MLLTSINPTTGKAITQVPVAQIEDYEKVVKDANDAFLLWRQVPAPKRGELIYKIGKALRNEKGDLGNLIALEMGKSKQEGDGEVQEMIDMADFSVGQARMLYGYTMHSERPQHRMYEQWHPYGVTGVITAFNFPVAVWAWNAFLAAIAGNTVIWKPSPKVPLCALAVQKICDQIMEVEGFKGIFNLLITDQNHLAQKLVEDSRVPLISFTGSTNVGRGVAEIVGRRLGRCILELGGNNGVIVDETADLSLAVPAIVFGAIGTAGQRCTTIRRLIVHENIYEELISRLIHRYKQIRIGDPLDQSNEMGPLIDKNAVDAYLAAVEEVKNQGGVILYGGEVIKREGFFVQPCLAQAENSWPVVQRETFAPIMYVMKFKTLDEAIEKHNSVKQGLSSALFTNDLRHAERFLSCLGSDCGIANINIGTSGAEIGGAFGGNKETGGGREAGSDAWKGYMRRQTTTINWGTASYLAQGIKNNLSG